MHQIHSRWYMTLTPEQQKEWGEVYEAELELLYEYWEWRRVNNMEDFRCSRVIVGFTTPGSPYYSLIDLGLIKPIKEQDGETQQGKDCETV